MSALPFKINTINKVSEFKQKEKGSLFLGYSSHIDSEQDALSYLSIIKKEHFDATHHCYSYKLANGFYKYSDDGEPTGTAGIRIYNAQNHFELTNLITIVVRYYGGKKLGVGPLGKIYYDTSFNTLNFGQKGEQILHQQIEINYDFQQTKLIHHLTSKYELNIINNLYDLIPKIICSIALSRIDDFKSELLESDCKNINLKVLNNQFYFSKSG